MASPFKRPERALDCAWCIEGKVPATEDHLCGGRDCLEWPADSLDPQGDIIADLRAQRLDKWQRTATGAFQARCPVCGEYEMQAVFEVEAHAFSTETIGLKQGDKIDFGRLKSRSEIETTDAEKRFYCFECSECSHEVYESDIDKMFPWGEKNYLDQQTIATA